MDVYVGLCVILLFSNLFRRVMSERDKALGMPRRPPSPASGEKLHDRNSLEGDVKWRRATRDRCSTQPPLTCASLQSVAGLSHVDNTVVSPSSEVNLDRLSTLLGALIDKLDKLAVPTMSAEVDFNFLPSDDETAKVSRCLPEPDPLDDLNLLTTTQPVSDTVVDVAFQKALVEFAGHFHSEEETGDPLSDRLAGILNASLRCRPSSDGVNLTCNKIKLLGNVPNLKVPVTNPAIIKAMSVGGKLVDTWLSLTNKLVTKALVPIVRCINDIGDK